MVGNCCLPRKRKALRNPCFVGERELQDKEVALGHSLRGIQIAETPAVRDQKNGILESAPLCPPATLSKGHLTGVKRGCKSNRNSARTAPRADLRLSKALS